MRRRARSILLKSLVVTPYLALVLSVATGGYVEAQTSDDLGVRLQTIRLEVATTKRTIEKLKGDFAKLKREEKTLATEIETLRGEESTLAAKSQTVAKERTELETKVTAAEAKVLEEQGRIRARLRSLYATTASGNQSGAAWLLAGSNIEQLAVYARSIRRYDETHFQEVRRAVSVLMQSRKDLDAALSESARLQQEVQKKRVESEEKQVKLQTVLQEIKDKQQSAQQSLSVLKGEAAKLEELMQQITTGDSAEPTVEQRDDDSDTPVPSSTPTKPSVAEDMKRTDPRGVEADDAEDVMHPEGLFGRTVRVTYPVTGDVLQKFGKSKVTEFEDMIFSKGLEYRTPEASQVRAVLGGRVAFAGTMPGYEMVVILDHGSRSYSLYGRLGKTYVAKGDRIKQGDAVGVTSAPDSKGRNFYFETRKNGNPVDPATVLDRAG
jgi:septal ring factor EnvC (AmiA/AmiB activator)